MGPNPLLKGSNRGVKQQGPPSQGFSHHFPYEIRFFNLKETHLNYKAISWGGQIFARFELGVFWAHQQTPTPNEQWVPLQKMVGIGSCSLFFFDILHLASKQKS